jgi:hypothetical protein
VAIPIPPSAPPDLRIFERATWPQMTAGIAVKSHPQKNERIARMRLQTARRRSARSRAGCRGRGWRRYLIGHRAVVTELKSQNQDAARDPCRRRCEEQKLRRLFPGAGCYSGNLLLTREPVRSPAALAGLTVYPRASQHGVFSSAYGRAR